MIKIGILGSDNSHAIGFGTHFNIKRDVPGGRVVAIYGLEEARTNEVAEKGQIPTIVKKPEDLIGMIDAAIVDFRHGSRHLKYAGPMIRAGIPTFIDKPFASSVKDAEAMVALAKKHKVPITTFSTVRFGTGLNTFKKDVAKIGQVKTVVIAGPGDARDQYDGIFFYAVHQVELMLEVFGNGIKSVRGMDFNGTLVASVLYKNGMVATIHETNAAYSSFTAAAFGEKGQASYDSNSSPDQSLISTKAMLQMFKTGKLPIATERLLDSTKILEAIQASMRKGGATIPVRGV